MLVYCKTKLLRNGVDKNHDFQQKYKIQIFQILIKYFLFKSIMAGPNTRFGAE